MTSRYQNAKIYRIVNNVDDLEFVGGTCSGLSQRLSQHKLLARKYPHKRLYSHLNSVGWENTKLILIESFPCPDKNHLDSRVRHHMNARNAVLNKELPPNSTGRL